MGPAATLRSTGPAAVPLAAALVLVALAFLAAPPPAEGQGLPATVQGAPASPPSAHDLLGMGWLTGTWEGEGWMRLGPERVERFRQLEVVRPAMGGRALVIEGTAFAMVDGRIIEGLPPVHEALAVLSLDAHSGEPTFRAWRAEGEGVLRVDAHAEIQDGALTWGFHDPSFGHFRYRISRTPAGEWHETGRFSPDGEQWFELLEMTLRRTSG